MMRLLLISLLFIAGCSSEKDEAVDVKALNEILEKQKPKFEKSFIVYCSYDKTYNNHNLHILRKFDSQTQTGKQIEFYTDAEYVGAPLYMAHLPDWHSEETTFRIDFVARSPDDYWGMKFEADNKLRFFVKNDNILEQIYNSTESLKLNECKSITAEQYTSLKDEYLTIFENFEANKNNYYYKKIIPGFIYYADGEIITEKEKTVVNLRDKYKGNNYLETYEIKAP